MIFNFCKRIKFKSLIKMKQTITSIILLILSASLFSQAPQAFNYQGVARDLSGSPIPDQSIGLRISILQGTITGPEVYKELHLVNTNILGLFTIQIGLGTAVNSSFNLIDWSNGNHFLKIEIDENGGSNYMDLGTSQLLSVPYALYAENSGDNSKWIDNQRGINYNSGNVGIGTDEPQTQLEIERPFGHANGATLLLTHGNVGSHVTQNASGGALHLYQSNDVSQTLIRSYGDSYTNVDVGNVGIGIREPKSKLQVANGDIYISDIQSGVIMKSPNGQCWRMTVDDTGNPLFTAVTCPN